MIEYLPANRRLVAKRYRPSTVADYVTKVRAFYCWLGGRPITAAVLLEYRDHLRLDRAQRTVRGVLAALSTWFRHLGAAGMVGLPAVPAALDPEENRQGQR